jgi:hypothetical protein
VGRYHSRLEGGSVMAPSTFTTTPPNVDFFESLGVAVFHQQRGLKGCFVEGWSSMPVEDSIRLTLGKLSQDQ